MFTSLENCKSKRNYFKFNSSVYKNNNKNNNICIYFILITNFSFGQTQRALFGLFFCLNLKSSLGRGLFLGRIHRKCSEILKDDYLNIFEYVNKNWLLICVLCIHFDCLYEVWFNFFDSLLVLKTIFFVTNFIQIREISLHASNFHRSLFSKLIRGPHGKWNTVNFMTHQTKTNVCQFHISVLFIFIFAIFNMSLYKIR